MDLDEKHQVYFGWWLVPLRKYNLVQIKGTTGVTFGFTQGMNSSFLSESPVFVNQTSTCQRRLCCVLYHMT